MRLRLLLLAFAAALGPHSVRADWQPSGPITMMIAATAGGGVDTQARLIAEALEERHGWQIIPEQRTGKGGAVLAAALKDEPSDGTAIGFLVGEALTYNMIAAGDPGYTQADFTPLTTTAALAVGVVALTSKGWKSWEDMAAAARAGETIRFGAMSPRYADLAYFMGQHEGLDFNIVTLGGGKAVMNALNAGDIDVGWGAGIQNRAVLAGDMVTLASGLDHPLAVSPDAPTMSDLGIAFTGEDYFMVIAPAGLPAEAREALTSAIIAVVEDQTSKANGFVRKAFGGPVVISGKALETLLKEQATEAQALLQAVSQ